jgi:hypothetical protein
MVLPTCFHDADHQRVSTWSSVAANNSSNFRTDYILALVIVKARFVIQKAGIFCRVCFQTAIEFKIEPR